MGRVLTFVHYPKHARIYEYILDRPGEFQLGRSGRVFHAVTGAPCWCVDAREPEYRADHPPPG